MGKRVISILIAIVMAVFCLPFSNVVSSSSILDEVRETYQTSIKKNEVVTSTEFEGNIILCKYVKSTQEYLLYLNDLEYKLDVSIEDDNIMVNIVNEEEESSVDNVYGQNPALLIAPLIPEVTAVIETCVITTVSTVAVIGTTYLSAELIDKVLISNSALLIQTDTTVADAAVSIMSSVSVIKTEYDESYFEATIQDNNNVFIGRLLTYKEAMIRLKSGYDIFAVDVHKAAVLAYAASPVSDARWHSIHPGKGERFEHYHPIGISWYKNKKHWPHVWYM